MSGNYNAGVTVCNFRIPKTGLYTLKEELLYAIPSDASPEDLDRKQCSMSGDLELPELINESLSESMSFYYGKVRDDGELSRGRFLEPKSPIAERGDRLRLNRVFIAGLPKEEAVRYYSEKLLKPPG